MQFKPSKRITVLLADDHPLARAGIRQLLSEADDLEIIGEAEDGFMVQKLVAELRPRILLLDLKMPGPRPAELENWVRENYPETLTLVLTAHDRDIYLAGMIKAGVSGYLSKNETSQQLIRAIRRAACGEIIFDVKQLTRARHWQEEVGKKFELLTNREHEILLLLAKGKDNKTIANTLNVQTKTVAYHITNILSKLQVASRQEALIWLFDYMSDNPDISLE